MEMFAQAGDLLDCFGAACTWVVIFWLASGSGQRF